MHAVLMYACLIESDLMNENYYDPCCFYVWMTGILVKNHCFTAAIEEANSVTDAM